MAFKARPNAEFILSNDVRLTRKQILAQIEALTAGLQLLGIGKGAHIVSLLPPGPVSVCTLFLPHFLGSVNIPLNPLLKEAELLHILKDSQAEVVITSPSWYGCRYPEILENLIPELPDLKYVLVSGEFQGDGGKFLSLKHLMQTESSPQRVHTLPTDITRIAYTSGTTGWPKGVVHTRQRAWGIAVRANRSRLDWMRCLLLPFPPYHFAGMFGIYVALMSGGKVILMERFNPQHMLELIENEGVTHIGASPSFYRLLLSVPGQKNYDLSSVKRITITGESAPVDLAEHLNHRFGCILENIYATTETNLISWTRFEDDWRLAAESVGIPVPGAQIRIVGDHHQLLPQGSPGEIAVKTNQMMLGYYNDPELTAQVLDEHGWFYTGDVGLIGEDSRLRLIDRKKDLIIRGGENISPQEIERVLEEHPAVRGAAVFGKQHPLSGEEIWAFIEQWPGSAFSSSEANAFCLDRLAPFKIPQKYRFIDQIPRTASGKPQKYKLRLMANEETNDKTPTAYL